MPSGSKKRKSSKKPKPQGDPSELEAGLEEAMGNNEVEVEEANPSPRGIEGDPGAMAERGLEGKEMNGEVPQEGDAVSEAPKEGFQTDEAVPDQDKGSQEDPPSQAAPEPEIPTAVEAEAPSVIELEGETAQGETEPQIDTPLLEFERRTDAAPEEIKPETELDAVPVESEPVTDAALDASSDEIKPDADIGLDEVESSKESATLEREFVLDAAPVGSESGIDESSLEAETKTEIDKGPDQFKSETDADPAEVESQIGGPLDEVKPEADATPYIELEMNDAPDEVPVEAEPKTDGARPETEEAQVEELETAAPANIEPETKEAPMERELETDAAPTDVEAEAEEALAEMELAIDAAPVNVEAEAEEALVEMELAIDAAPADVKSETAVPADIEPGTEKAPMERELETDGASTDVEAEAEESLAERELAIDAAPTDVEPETDVEAEAEEALAERELAIDAAPADVDREMDATPADTEAETDTAQVEIDASPDEIQPEIDAASPENETVEIEPDVNAALVEAEQDEVSQADIHAAPEPEPEVEALVEGEPEVNTEDVDNLADIEAKRELPQETEPEPKPLDVAEGTSLEPPQETEPESEVVVADESKPEDEASVESNGDERGSVETESDHQALVGGETEAPPEIDPEPEVETSRGIELEAEAEAPLEAEPEAVVEAPDEAEPDEKGRIETESDQQDLGEMEPDQSGVKEHDQQLLKQEGEAALDELDTSFSEDNQPSESQLQVADALEVPVIEDEPPAISASDEANSVDDSTSSTSSSEVSDNADNESTAIEQEREEGDDIPTGAIEQTRGAAVDNEQGAADEMPAESKEDVSEEQERAVDIGHDDDGAVLASAGNGGETEESSEKELAIELPPADVEESAKEDISEQERAVDIGHDEDGAVLASARNGGAAEVSSVLPPADVVDAEESAKEGPSDQEPVTEQSQPRTDEQDRSMGLGAAADEPPSVLFEQSLNAILPSFGSEMTSDAPEPQDEAVTPANGENVSSEHEYNAESACGELERDIGEEEAASSTVAEAGSVLNDFDERGSYEQEIPTDFPSTDQDVDIPDCKEFDDNSSIEVPEYVQTGLREQLDSEPSPAEKVDANAGCGLEATSEQQEVLLESPEAAKPAEDLHSVPVEEVSSDEQLPSSPQPEQVVPDSGEDKIHSSKEVVLANEELRTAEEERAACEDDKVAANSILGTSLPIIAGDELISKALTYLENGRESLSNSEGPSKELAEHRDESSVHQSEANNMDEPEIHAMDTKELKEAEHNPMGGHINNDADEAPVDYTSPIQEGRDITGVQAFRQESTQEASLPVVVPAQDRALEHVSMKSAERPNGGGTLERRTELLGCCGMFDLLLRKN